MWKLRLSSGLSKCSLIFLYQEVCVSILGKGKLCRILEKKAYKRCSAWRKVYRQEWISKDESGAAIRRNPYKIGRIVDRSIDFVTFFS